MDENHTNLDARLGDAAERRKRLDEELERVGAELRRMSENQEPAPWWLRKQAAPDSLSTPGPRRGLGPVLVTVVVPIHNAHQELAACLRALARHTTYPASLLLIDDGSTDPRIDELLEMASG